MLTLREATITAGGPNTAGRFRAVVATSRPVPRPNGVLEVLDLDAPGCVESFRGVPVLDNHKMFSVRNTLGRVVHAERQGDAIVAEFELSEADDVAPIRQRIEDGTLTAVSVGYHVSEWRRAGRVHTAKKWEAHEVSLVNKPADIAARIIRSDSMEDDVKTRRAEIRALVRGAGLGSELADDLIDADADLDAAKAAIFDALAAQPKVRAVPRAGCGVGDRAAIVEALAYRMAPVGEPSEAARPFLSVRALDHARAAVERSGQSARCLSDAELHFRSMTTTDFPEVLGDAMNLTALRSYRAAQSALGPLFVRKSFSDFRAQDMVRLTDLGNLEPLAEDGEIRQQPRGEERESMRLRTFASGVSLTREVLINDSLGLFGDTVAALGQAAAHTEADAMAALLTSPPPMRDGNSPWHGDSQMATPAALDDAGLSAARLAMRTRRGPAGRIIEAAPWALVVGPELETTAERLLSAVQAARVADVNVFAGSLRLIVEPRITGRAWHLFADPSAVPCLAYAGASFAPGPQVAREDGFNVLATRWRVVLDFGVGWIDRRGALRNAGL